MLRFLTAGESHGRALVVILEGVPAGLLVTAEDIQRGLARRRLGYGRGPRMRFEADEVTLIGGIRHGRTIGSPVAIEIANTEWPHGEDEMSFARDFRQGLHSNRPEPRRPLGQGSSTDRRCPRRSSRGLGAETAARVVAGTALFPLPRSADIRFYIVQPGTSHATTTFYPLRATSRIDASAVRCSRSRRRTWRSPRSRRRPKRVIPRRGGRGGGRWRPRRPRKPRAHWDRRLDVRHLALMKSARPGHQGRRARRGPGLPGRH